MGRRSDIDWDAIIRDYRIGQWTDRELGKKYGVSHTAIMRRAAKEAWPKDLSAEVRQRTRAALSGALIADERTGKAPDGALVQAVDEKVATNVSVVRDHQSYFRRSYGVLDALLPEAEAGAHRLQTMPRETALQRAQRLSEAVKVADLTERCTRIASKLFPLERQAFGIDDTGAPPPDPVKDAKAEELRQQLFRLLSDRAVPIGGNGQARVINGNGRDA